MKLCKLLSGVIAASVSLCAFTAVTFAAPLYSGSSEKKRDYEINADAYTDYSNVGAIEAVVTASGSASGCIGVNDLNNNWISAPNSTTAGTSTWRLDGLSGIFAVTDKVCIYIQFWSVDSGTYSVDKVTLYDTDGKIITPGDKIVERKVEKLPDAEKERMTTDKFMIGRKFDIGEAVGDDFGDIGAIDVTVKWSDASYGWSGGGNVYGVEQADGASGSWLGSKAMGNVEENEALRNTATEGTYRLFDFSDNPIVKLTTTGVTGEISGYATMELFVWWTDNDNVNPTVSNITIYNTKGKVLASYDYKTKYDDVATEAVAATAEEPALTDEATTTTAAETVADVTETTTATATEAVTTSEETTSETDTKATTAAETTAAEAETTTATAETTVTVTTQAQSEGTGSDGGMTVIIVVIIAVVAVVGVVVFVVIRKKK